MKRLALLLILIIPITLFARNSPPSGVQSSVIRDSIAVADTAATSERTDIDTTEIVPVSKFTHIVFYAQATVDTNWANDSCFAVLQLSVDLGNGTYDWQTVDTVIKIAAPDSVYGGVVHKLDTLGYIADYMRLIVLHRHTLAAYTPGILANTYDVNISVWFKLWD